jgi:hypothetical protein
LLRGVDGLSADKSNKSVIRGTLRSCPKWVAAALMGAIVPCISNAQVLRIGGFDFNAKAHSELVYSTNVEQERSTETSAKREDYYVSLGIDLNSVRSIGRSTTLDLSTGISVEKHFVRDDLDNSQNPFGHFKLSSSTEARNLLLKGFASYDRLSESSNDRFSSDGLGKARDPRTEIGYGAGAAYTARRLTARADYDYRTEKHDKEQFSERDLDEINFLGQIEYQVHSRFSPNYSYEYTDSKYPSKPSSDRTEVNHRFALPFELMMNDPHLLYTFTWQKEDRGDGVQPKWLPRHTISISDEFRLSPSLDLSIYAMYDNYPQPAKDEIQFTYGAMLRHQISRTADHSISATRQPVETFGTTQKSDQTTYSYGFNKSDLFIYNLNMSLTATREHTIPVLEDGSDGNPQDTTTYDILLTHTEPVTRRLTRTIQYLYSLEDDSTQEEKLTEHRVTLRYQYEF